MGGMVPLGDASRRPARVPVVTAGIIVVNVVVFVLELMRGDAFVTQWAAVPAQIVSGHHWITILTAMLMHGSWSHIIGNMIFLWAFAPEIGDAMGRVGSVGVASCVTGGPVPGKWSHAPLYFNLRTGIGWSSSS